MRLWYWLWRHSEHLSNVSDHGRLCKTTLQELITGKKGLREPENLWSPPYLIYKNTYIFGHQIFMHYWTANTASLHGSWMSNCWHPQCIFKFFRVQQVFPHIYLIFSIVLGKTALDEELLHTSLQVKPFIPHFWQKAWLGECVSVQMTVWTEFWRISKHIRSKGLSNALALQLDTQRKNPMNTTL